MKVTHNGRPIEITELDFALDEGAYVLSAYYIDTEVDLTEDECLEVEEACQGQLYEEAYIDAASNAYDSYKDRE